jgi:membrane-associated HD superfamily phosphohydrolase
MFLYRIILTLYREMSIRSKKYVTLVSVQISDQDYNISIYCFSAGNLFVVIVVIVVYHQFSNSSAISWGEQVNFQ